MPFRHAHYNDILPLQALRGMDGRNSEILVGNGNRALDIVLLDEARERFSVDSESEEEICNRMVLLSHRLQGLQVLEYFLFPVAEESFNKGMDYRFQRDLITHLGLIPDVVLDIFKYETLPGIIESLNIVPAGESVKMHAERPVNGSDAIGVVAVDYTEEVIEKLDMGLYYLLPAKDSVGYAGRAQQCDECLEVP